MKLEIEGIYKLTNKFVVRPDKKCMNCPLFEDDLGWCRWLKIKIDDYEYYEKCPVIEIIIEEG